MIAPEHAFQAAIAASGLTPPDAIIADGAIHRFAPNGERNDDAGWYILHLDNVPAGVFGNWREGRSENWCSVDRNEQTPAQRIDVAKRIKAMSKARDDAKKAEQHKAAETASVIWAAATSIEDAPVHGYLLTKGIQSQGARLIDAATARGHCSRLSPELVGPLLVVPMRDAALMGIPVDRDRSFRPIVTDDSGLS